MTDLPRPHAVRHGSTHSETKECVASSRCCVGWSKYGNRSPPRYRCSPARFLNPLVLRVRVIEYADVRYVSRAAKRATTTGSYQHAFDETRSFLSGSHCRHSGARGTHEALCESPAPRKISATARDAWAFLRARGARAGALQELHGSPSCASPWLGASHGTAGQRSAWPGCEKLP